MEQTPLRVLVLEDEWLIADDISDALRAAGHDVVGPVGTVIEALALIETQRLDAAVLDVNLHGERSYQVAEKLIALSKPFVFVSGYAPSDLPSGLSSRPFLKKPVEASQVCSAVGKLFAPNPSGQSVR